MSRATVTKLQVDVLVQAAMFGPMGATHWTALAPDADALGQSLMFSGSQPYVFTPLPVGLTPIEVIKACNYFRYQRSRVPKIIDRLVEEMVSRLDGWSDAPWGWDVDDVAARLDRPAPGSDLPAPPPLVLTEVADRLTAIGWQPGKIAPVVSSALGTKIGASAPDVFHGVVSASHVEYRAGKRWVSGCNVLVATSSGAAAKAFPWLVGAARQTEVRRVGNLLVRTSYAPADLWPDPEAARALDRLGIPDDLWSENELPLLSGPGRAVASHARMALSFPVLVSTKGDLEKLLSRLHDPEVVDELRQVDLREHSVLAAPTVEVGEVSRVELVRGGTESGPSMMTEDLVVVHQPTTSDPTVLGSIIVTPRLRRRPTFLNVASTKEDRHVTRKRPMGKPRDL